MTTEAKAGMPMPAILIDPRNLTFKTQNGAVPRQIFDGQCLLEPECYEVTSGEGVFLLKRPPAFEIKTLS